VSTGLVICSVCGLEAHQAQDHTWFHCSERTPLCEGAYAAYPRYAQDVRGPACLADGPLPPSRMPEK